MSDTPEGGRPTSRLARALGLIVAARIGWRAARRKARDAPPSSLAHSDTEPYEDPSERTVPGSRRAENLVAILLLLGAGCAFAFIAFYIILQTNTQLLGLAMGCALALLAAAAIVAGKMVVPQETSVEPRDQLLKEEAVEEVVEIVESGGEGISRRILLTGAGGLAGAAVLGAAAAPLASLGPPAGSSLHQSPWRRGIRLIDDQGHLYAAADIQIGSFYSALPQGGNPDSLGAGVLVIRLPESMIHLPAARQSWAPQGIMAYSKICPHAGCAINLYRYPLDESTAPFTPAFTCPCHYSTFTPGDGGKLIFGPAGRELPQMPILIDSDGNLRCAGPFDEDIGPSWWGVRRT